MNGFIDHCNQLQLHECLQTAPTASICATSPSHLQYSCCRRASLHRARYDIVASHSRHMLIGLFPVHFLLCRRKMSVCLSLRPSVTSRYYVATVIRILKLFHLRVATRRLVFLYQTVRQIQWNFGGINGLCKLGNRTDM